MDDLPGMENAPTPFAAIERVQHRVGAQASFDAGRGCPFLCSFCTIINVQGRKSRYRNADDVGRIIRDHVRQGVERCFISDANFARDRNWEAIYDRLIELREMDPDLNTPEHVETLMRRAIVSGFSPGKVLGSVVWFHAGIVMEGVHPLESGYVRRKYRRDRRPGLSRENWLVFYPRYLREFFFKHWYMLCLLWKYHRKRKALLADPTSRYYTGAYAGARRRTGRLRTVPGGGGAPGVAQGGVDRRLGSPPPRHGPVRGA